MVPLLGNFESMIEEVSKLRMFILSCLSYEKEMRQKSYTNGETLPLFVALISGFV